MSIYNLETVMESLKGLIEAYESGYQTLTPGDIEDIGHALEYLQDYRDMIFDYVRTEV